MQHDTASDVLDVGYIERDQLRAPQGGGESNQQQRAIPEVFEGIARSVEHQEKVIAKQRLCLQLSTPSLSFYAAQRRPD